MAEQNETRTFTNRICEVCRVRQDVEMTAMFAVGTDRTEWHGKCENSHDFVLHTPEEFKMTKQIATPAEAAEFIDAVVARDMGTVAVYVDEPAELNLRHNVNPTPAELQHEILDTFDREWVGQRVTPNVQVEIIDNFIDEPVDLDPAVATVIMRHAGLPVPHLVKKTSFDGSFLADVVHMFWEGMASGEVFESEADGYTVSVSRP